MSCERVFINGVGIYPFSSVDELIYYADKQCSTYPYLCDKFHLGIFYLSFQVVDFMALGHDLNDELILTDVVMVSDRHHNMYNMNK